MVIGYDGLQNRMKLWEQQASEIEDLSITEPTYSESSMLISGPQDTVPALPEMKISESLGYLMVGLGIKFQERLEDRIRNAKGLSKFMGNITKPILRPLSSNRAFIPMRNRFDNLVLRGQQEIDQWIESGRRETIQSRALVRTAIHERMNSSIEYLANDPQVEELVSTQSASLIDEMVEEVRERTVSADDFLESIVRSTLKLPLRSELPPPPPELKRHAIPYRVRKGRTIYK
jgi:hypothetical protein